MASQRHKREHFFFGMAHPASVTPGDIVGPMPPLDAADEKAEAVVAGDKAYGERAAWPTAARETVVPV